MIIHKNKSAGQQSIEIHTKATLSAMINSTKAETVWRS